MKDIIKTQIFQEKFFELDHFCGLQSFFTHKKIPVSTQVFTPKFKNLWLDLVRHEK